MIVPPPGLVDALRGSRRFLITSHVSPDGDSVATSLGLRRLLVGLGKDARIWHADAPPASYRSLPDAEHLFHGEHPPAELSQFDWLVALECPTPERSGLAAKLTTLRTINIDHHRGNSMYGDQLWVDEASPAVGEMVLHIARALGATLDVETANLLYLALHTDTGGFRFSNATARAFDAAARMVEAGAQPEVVAGWLYERRPAASVRLLAECLATLELSADGRIATVILRPDMLERSGASPADSEGLVDLPRSIEGVQAVGLLRELGDCRIKLSLRSRGLVDVEAIARSWGGGGHRNAAGCVVEGDTQAVLDRVRAALASALAQTGSNEREP